MGFFCPVAANRDLVVIYLFKTTTIKLLTDIVVALAPCRFTCDNDTWIKIAVLSEWLIELKRSVYNVVAVLNASSRIGLILKHDRCNRVSYGQISSIIPRENLNRYLKRPLPSIKILVEQR